MQHHYHKLFAQIDELIKAGDPATAKQLLLTEKIAKLPRDQRLAFAIQCRRLHLHGLSLKTLNPVVRPSSRKTADATEREKAEYAVALSNIGATTEALNLLTSLDPTQNPEVSLLTAFTLFSRWNYSQAIPHLERYIHEPQLTPYARLVGKINLAAALIFDRQRSAEPLLLSIIEECKTTKSIPALAYTERLLAEHHFLQGNRREARALLTRAWQAFHQSDSLEALFTQKWMAILDFYESRSSNARESMEKVKAVARSKKHWETIRNCDYHLAIALQDINLLQRVLAGSPYDEHNKKLLLDFGIKRPLEPFYTWQIGSRGQYELNLENLPTALLQRTVRPGRRLYQLLTALTSDFYRPLRIAELHANLFPEEYFNPRSSPHRIAQLMMRLRTALKSARVPLMIVEEDGAYHLESPGISIRVPLRRSYSAANDGRLAALKTLSLPYFTIHEASKHLRLEPWTVKRLLREAVAARILEKVGGGNRVKYRYREQDKVHKKAS